MRTIAAFDEGAAVGERHQMDWHQPGHAGILAQP
jgi:hypothetical protein